MRNNSHILIDEFMVVHLDTIEKITLNRDRTKGWLKLKGDPKLIHLDTDNYYRISNKLIGLTPLNFSNDLKIEPKMVDYVNPHRFDPIMYDSNTCTCGAHKDNKAAHREMAK